MYYYDFTYDESLLDRYFQITPDAGGVTVCNGFLNTQTDPTGKLLRVDCRLDAGGFASFDTDVNILVF